ncbi:MAG: ribosomal protein S18-alanine N-acetyltransferase [Clostridia bacterium]|nr:ribosomal protein S18-alanine N-acetyltransferase [Clostridia bacterium]
MTMEIKITQASPENLDGITAVENASFTIPWSRKSFEAELNNETAVYFIASDGSTVTGYAGMWKISGQCDITNIAVLPEYRNKGIGSALLCRLTDYCRENSLSPITLEVRESNLPAQGLYKKFGFEPVGRRKRYYADTDEDAIIMSLSL